MFQPLPEPVRSVAVSATVVVVLVSRPVRASWSSESEAGGSSCRPPELQGDPVPAPPVPGPAGLGATGRPVGRGEESGVGEVMTTGVVTGVAVGDAIGTGVVRGAGVVAAVGAGASAAAGVVDRNAPIRSTAADLGTSRGSDPRDIW